MPGALLVVLLGMVVAVIQYPSVLRALRFGPSVPHVIWPSWDEWKKGLVSSQFHHVWCSCCFKACVGTACRGQAVRVGPLPVSQKGIFS